MNILFIGDIVGSCGRHMLEKSMMELERTYKPDVIIMNGENAAHGKGLSKKVAKELFDLGADVITSGNHIWQNKDIFEILEDTDRVLRPANMPKNNPGTGSVVIEKNGVKVGVINLIGRVYLNPADCPFEAADREIAKLKKETDIIFVDFHAEATSEKVAMGWYLDGRVSCVAGTHTHIQTADEAILPKKTAYITDAGMTGAYFGVLGMDRDIIINRFTTQLPGKFELAEGGAILSGICVNVDEKTGQAVSIERIYKKDF